MSKRTDRRKRFGHLLGCDRYRVVLRWVDGSFGTESFDELTVDRAKTTAASLLAPATYRGDWPDSVEIWLGQFQAVGVSDCEWKDLRLCAAATTTPTGLVWTDTNTPAIDPTFGEQLELI